MSTSLVTTHEPRCKICKSPYRHEIDQLLLKRAFSEKDTETGLKLNGKLICKRAADYGIPGLTELNLSGHWRKHCKLEQTSKGTVAKTTGEIGTALKASEMTHEELVEIIMSRPLGPDSFADDVILIAQMKARQTVANGSLPNISIDQGLKAVDVKTRRRHNEKVVELLDLQAEALTQSLGYEAEDAEVVEID